MPQYTKDPNVNRAFEIDYERELVLPPRRAADFFSGDIVRPHIATGFLYECTTAGKTAQYFPVWPRAAGATVQDGSAVWTARHPYSPTLPTIASAQWIVPGGLSLVSQSEQRFVASATIGGGVVGVVYTLTCRITTTNGRQVDQSIDILVQQA